MKMSKMLISALEDFSNSLFIFLTEEENVGRGLLLKKHSENFLTHGDYSFINTVKSWQEFLKEHFSTDHNNNYLKCIRKTTDDLVDESKNWSLGVLRVREEKDRVYLYLNRTQALRCAFSEITQNISLLHTALLKNKHLVLSDPRSENSTCITALRMKYVCKCIENIYKISCSGFEEWPLLFVTAKSTSHGPEGCKKLLCGTVLNSKTGSKESTLRADDFIRKRQEEMTLIAQHKYGVRVSNDSKWKDFISSLGKSAVMFELLQTKPTSPVKINFDSSAAGASKGASFILYNCARLETIIRTYEGKVEEKVYPELPPVDDIDFSLLTQEEEWSLVYNYILGLPSALANCVDVSDFHQTCEFKPHQLCVFLSSMVKLFSQYYRKVRILTYYTGTQDRAYLPINAYLLLIQREPQRSAGGRSLCEIMSQGNIYCL